MFSRAGLATLATQKFIGGYCRISKVLGFKTHSLSIQKRKALAIFDYQTWCVEFLAEALQSTQYDLFIDFETKNEFLDKTGFIFENRYDNGQTYMLTDLK